MGLSSQLDTGIIINEENLIGEEGGCMCLHIFLHHKQQLTVFTMFLSLPIWHAIVSCACGLVVFIAWKESVNCQQAHLLVTEKEMQTVVAVHHCQW